MDFDKDTFIVMLVISQFWISQWSW